MDNLDPLPPEHDETDEHVKTSSAVVRSFAQRRAYLHGTFFQGGDDALGRHFAIAERLKRDETAMGYWAGTGGAPSPCPFALPEPDPDRSFVLGLLSTFDNWYLSWPAAARQRPQRSVLLCAAGQAKLAPALMQRHSGSWTVVHPDRRVTSRLKAARLEDPMVRDRARLSPGGFKGLAADNPHFLTALAASKLSVRTAPIEQTGLPAACCELVVIDQAHLSADLHSVYAEANRLLRRGGMIFVTGRMPVHVGGAVDDLIWELIASLRPVFTKHDRWLYDFFQTEAFPFRSYKVSRLRSEAKTLHWHTDVPWRSTAMWNLATFVAQTEAWPVRQRLAKLGSDRVIGVMKILQEIEDHWGKSSIQRAVNVPIFARAGLKC